MEGVVQARQICEGTGSGLPSLPYRAPQRVFFTCYVSALLGLDTSQVTQPVWAFSLAICSSAGISGMMIFQWDDHRGY
jgi:hypothetical protein